MVRVVQGMLLRRCAVSRLVQETFLLVTESSVNGLGRSGHDHAGVVDAQPVMGLHRAESRYLAGILCTGQGIQGENQLNCPN